MDKINLTHTSITWDRITCNTYAGFEMACGIAQVIQKIGRSQTIENCCMGFSH